MAFRKISFIKRMKSKQNKSVLENCKLCNGFDKLQKSHVLPEFIYKNLYDSTHRFLDLGLSNEKILEIQQKGLRERLLCANCEMRLGRHESYVAPYLAHKKFAISLRDEGIVNYVNYKLLKLFQISILWKAHHSTHPLFRNVNVGKKHEKKLREMLLADQPGEPHEYGCVTAEAKFGKRTLDDFIPNVMHHKTNGYNSYTFIFAGFVWSYVVSSHSRNHLLKNDFLQRDGALVIPSCEVKNSPIFSRAFELFQKSKEILEKL